MQALKALLVISDLKYLKTCIQNLKDVELYDGR